MLTNITNRFRRAPTFAISVILLSAILAGSLCSLHAANKAEQRNFEMLWQNTPVKLIVTNLSATRRDKLNAPTFVFQAFNTTTVKNNLTEYVKDVQMKASHAVDSVYFESAERVASHMVGITDLDISGKLLNAGREQIQWFDGYSAEILKQQRDVCLIPESWIDEGTDLAAPLSLTAIFSYSSDSPTNPATYTASYTFTVIGTHRASEDLLYCPFKTMQMIFRKVSHPLELDAIQATLVDNDLQDEIREAAKAWFAEPNPTGAKTRWDYSWYFYYLYALDIDNDQLISAERTLKTSMLVNEICAYLLFVLSAGASFFVGFLMIRHRRREISLMRTLGTANGRIFLEFAFEQIIFAILGAGLGALPFLWQPIERLTAFVGIYVFSLCIALVVFLNTNLLSTMKEAE